MTSGGAWKARRDISRPLNEADSITPHVENHSKNDVTQELTRFRGRNRQSFVSFIDNTSKICSQKYFENQKFPEP